MFDVIFHQLFLGYLAIGLVAIGVAFIAAEASVLFSLAIVVVLSPGLCAYFLGGDDQEKWVVIAGSVETPFILLALGLMFWESSRRMLVGGVLFAFGWTMAVYPIAQLLGIPSPELMNTNQLILVTVGLCVMWGLSMYILYRLWPQTKNNKVNVQQPDYTVPPTEQTAPSTEDTLSESHPRQTAFSRHRQEYQAARQRSSKS